MSFERRLYRPVTPDDREQILAIASRRSRLSTVGAVLLYALVFFVPVWVYESQRARQTALALEVQRLQENRRQLKAALQEANARLEALRGLNGVEAAATQTLGLARVPMQNVLPAAAKPAAAPARTPPEDGRGAR